MHSKPRRGRTIHKITRVQCLAVFGMASPAKKRYMPHLVFGIACFILRHIIQRKSSDIAPLFRSSSKFKDENLPTFDFPSSITKMPPPHLTPIDPSTLISKGAHTIDFAHRNGYLHTGSILYVMDAAGSLLFLQRSSHVVTCPGTWSILGEHSTSGEEVIETVIRGVEEELGFTSLGYNKEDGPPGTWTVELRPNKMKESLHVKIRSATELPLYYIRHYGPRNENRIDSQLTYLWSVQFPKNHDEIQWKLDDEVADHKWISLEEVKTWLADDATTHNQVFKSESGMPDDGPDVGDFCHKTIRVLYEAGLKGVTIK